MKVYVCQIVLPPLSQEIQAETDYNEHLTKCGETNGINVIKTVPTFRLGTSEIDDLVCFDIENDSYSALNRLGAIKLSTIKRQCPDFHLCTNWEEKKKKNYKHQ